jgi:hypothetical protein
VFSVRYDLNSYCDLYELQASSGKLSQGAVLNKCDGFKEFPPPC